VAIADTFDAITHRRQYSDGRSVEDARQILLEGRGVLFDPQLVDVFLLPPVWDRVLATYRRVSRWREPIASRRPGRRETQVPDIMFRWRPPRRAAHARHSPGHRHRTAR